MYTIDVKHEATQRDNDGFELIEPHAHEDLPKGRPRARLPQVRLEKSGAWVISRNALNLVGDPEAVTLRHDSQEGRVGFGGTEKGETAAYLVSSPGPRSGKALDYNSELRSRHGISHDGSKIYTARPKGRLLGIDCTDRCEERLRITLRTCRLNLYTKPTQEKEEREKKVRYPFRVRDRCRLD